MTIKEYKIKIIGTANIPQELENGANCDIGIKNAEVRGISEDPNDDGTVDKTYKIKISELSEVVIISKDKRIFAKVKGSQSKTMRACLYKLYESKFSNDEHFIDFEDFYQKRMSESIDLIKSEID